MTGIDSGRIRAIVAKELRDYRRKRSIVATMAILPAVFLIQPTLAVFLAPVTKSNDSYFDLPLLLLLLIPVITPSTLAAYSVVGEREQGTLEPVLTTPVQTKEFILGKAAAVMIPTLGISYSVYAIFLAVVRLLAKPAISSRVFHQGPVLLALVLFTPLLAGWAVTVGLAISVRASEVRVAQQLGMVASFPPLIVTVLMGVGIINPTVKLALGAAVAFLVIDLRALGLVARLFDRERLLTGAKAAAP